MLFNFYKFLLTILSPFIYLYIYIRVLKGKEDSKRLGERFGKTSMKRPEGRLVWIHGASVGETLSALPLIEEMKKNDSKLNFLITSGTKTSAELLKTRMPKGVIHQFVPIDLPWTTHRFLAYWKPRLAIRIDSEIWPVAIKQINDLGIPHIMANARISDKSFNRFMKFKSARKFLFSKITACFAKSKAEKDYFKKLGISAVEQMDNLKLSASLASPDTAKLNALKKEIGSRPFWLGASTGRDEKGNAEESFVIDAHKKLKKDKPKILTIISLRHTNRANEVIAMIKKAGLTYAQRSKGEKLTKDTDIYLFDTFGEMALLYTVAEIVFSGRSLVKWGGNTPVEPCGMKCALLVGPHTFNFKELYGDLEKHKAILRVVDANDLYKKVSMLFKDTKKRNELIKNGYNFVKDKQKTAQRLAKKITPFLKPIAWLVIDNRRGTSNQLVGIAKYLENFTILEKKITYSWKIKLPNFLHSIFGVPHSKDSVNLFSGQAPDLILSAGRRTASTGIWLKNKYPNAILAHMLKPNLPLKNFDLVILPDHDSGKKTHKKIITYSGATHRFTTEMLADAKKEWAKEFKDCAKPRISVLIGGSTKSKTFSEKDATKLANVLKQTKKDLGGSLLITTSRRTGEKQTEILRKETNADYFYGMGDPRENPFVGLLGTADMMVVTGESMSMLAEATSAKKPLFIYAPKTLMIKKHQRFVDSLYEKGLAKPFSSKTLTPFKPSPVVNEAKRVAKILIDSV
ncbi:MAG: ELM1/GtrOC1 family putative glycosyltransferase [Alphaproteobacteria bacterium]